jgi:hypothetical protein
MGRHSRSDPSSGAAPPPDAAPASPGDEHLSPGETTWEHWWEKTGAHPIFEDPSAPAPRSSRSDRDQPAHGLPGAGPGYGDTGGYGSGTDYRPPPPARAPGVLPAPGSSGGRHGSADHPPPAPPRGPAEDDYRSGPLYDTGVGPTVQNGFPGYDDSPTSFTPTGNGFGPPAGGSPAGSGVDEPTEIGPRGGVSPAVGRDAYAGPDAGRDAGPSSGFTPAAPPAGRRRRRADSDPPTGLLPAVGPTGHGDSGPPSGFTPVAAANGRAAGGPPTGFMPAPGAGGFGNRDESGPRGGMPAPGAGGFGDRDESGPRGGMPAPGALPPPGIGPANAPQLRSVPDGDRAPRALPGPGALPAPGRFGAPPGPGAAAAAARALPVPQDTGPQQTGPYEPPGFVSYDPDGEATGLIPQPGADLGDDLDGGRRSRMRAVPDPDDTGSRRRRRRKDDPAERRPGDELGWPEEDGKPHRRALRAVDTGEQPPAEDADDEDYGDEAPLVLQWGMFVLQTLLGAAAGLGVWLGFHQLWKQYPFYAALGVGGAVTLMLVIARWLRRRYGHELDLLTAIIVMGIGVVLTVLPAAFALQNR